MIETTYRYKIGSGKTPVILSFFMAALFGGLAFWLHHTENGAFTFMALLFFLTFSVFLLAVYRFLFYKILIGFDGFYYQTRIGNGKHYRYIDVKKAWVSSGKTQNGIEQSYCNISFHNGTVIRFPFYGIDSDAVDYLIEQTKASGIPAASAEQDTYLIDGKHFGKARIAAGFLLLVIFSLANFFAVKATGFSFFLIPSAAMELFICLYLILNYQFFKVTIDKDGFYFRTTPWNGRYYAYREIISCREIKKVVRHHGSGNTGKRNYYFFFEFVDTAKRKRRFLFEKSVYAHEISILKTRIEQARSRKGIAM